MSDVHTCSYYCDRPACIKAQRDDLRDRQAALQSGEPVAWLCDAGDGANVNATCSLAALADYTRFGRKITPLYTTPQPVVPEGYVLVPKSALDGALYLAGLAVTSTDFGSQYRADFKVCCEALLSAGKGGE